METWDDLAFQVAQHLIASKQTLCVAESCTGGGLGYALTAVPGSSAWFVGGYITYCNDLKKQLLGVSTETLETQGAVSPACVQEMAMGAVKRLGADIGIAISGIAGPEGGCKEKPVGTVYIAWYSAASERVERFMFVGNRENIRRCAIINSLEGLLIL